MSLETHDLMQPRQWVVARRLAPMYLLDAGVPFRPHILIIWDVENDALLSLNVLHPKELLDDTIQNLRRTIERACSSTEARPQVIRVDNENLANEIRRIITGIEVVVRETPEVDKPIRQFGESMQRRLDAPSYFENGRLREPVLRNFFSAVSHLYRAMPWDVLAEDAIFLLSIPALDMHRVCVSVASRTSHHGFVVFENRLAYHHFAREQKTPEVTTVTTPRNAALFAVNFEQGAKVHRALRREIATHQFEIAGPDAYPTVMRLDMDGVYRPLVQRDYEIGALCAAALAQFCDEHRPLFAETDPLSTACAYQVPFGDTKHQVEIVFPHPEARLVFDDSSPIAFDSQTSLVPWDRWADAFILAQKLDARSDAWCSAAMTHCRTLLHWKCVEFDGLPDRWTPAQLQYFLLERCSERVVADPSAVQLLPEVLQEFFRWLGQEGHIPGRVASQIEQRIGRVRGDFLRLVHERTQPAEVVRIF